MKRDYFSCFSNKLISYVRVVLENELGHNLAIDFGYLAKDKTQQGKMGLAIRHNEAIVLVVEAKSGNLEYGLNFTSDPSGLLTDKRKRINLARIMHSLANRAPK